MLAEAPVSPEGWLTKPREIAGTADEDLTSLIHSKLKNDVRDTS